MGLRVAGMGLSLLLSSTAVAQYRSDYGYGAPYQPPPSPPTSVVTPVKTETLQVSGQYYDASLGGLRAYVDTLPAADPPLHSAVDPKLRSLESRATSGKVIMIGGGIVGLGVFVGGLASGDEDGMNLPLVLGGSAIAFAS